LRVQEAQGGAVVADGRTRQITANCLGDEGADGFAFHHGSCTEGAIGVFVEVSDCRIHLVLLVTHITWPRMDTESAGINRHGIGNERVLRERNSKPS
jgi:hypothetical protein